MTLCKRISVLATAAIIAVPTVLAATDADAQNRHNKWRNQTTRSYSHSDSRGGNEAGSALIGGAIGLATGLIIGNSLSQPQPRPVYRHRRYYDYAPVPVYRPRPVYYYDYGPRPWTSAWYDYCSAKYRSFDPESGTFQPHYGPRKICR